jgi:hypothetical protein
MDGVRDYFKLPQEHLSYQNMSFPDTEVFADVQAMKVGVKGKAEFTWLSTGQSWNGTFSYIISFDSECKITSYEVWADSGAAYLTSTGKLDRARKE